MLLQGSVVLHFFFPGEPKFFMLFVRPVGGQARSTAGKRSHLHFWQWQSALRRIKFQDQINLIHNRSYQGSTRPSHCPGMQWFSLYFEKYIRTDGRTVCVKIVIITLLGLWSASWINIFIPIPCTSSTIYKSLNPNRQISY